MIIRRMIKYVQKSISDQLYYLYGEEKKKKVLKKWYRKKCGKELDLDNPTSFNEKIQWLKLYDNTKLKTELADKYLVRRWVSDCIGKEYLIPLLGVWESFSEIDFEMLPDEFVLKTNHASGWNSIIKSKNQMDYKQEKNKFDLWMKKDFSTQYGYELHYMNIPHKIIAEQYLEDLNDELKDYRFFCFSGKVKYVWVDSGSGSHDHRRTIFDSEWKKQGYEVNYPEIDPIPIKPDTFDDMKKCSEILSRDFVFVRVDFYSVNNKIWFGEMTFTPQSGVGQWSSDEQNNMYGELIELPQKTSIPKKNRCV